MKGMEQFLRGIVRRKLDIKADLLESAAQFIHSLGYDVGFIIPEAVLRLKPDLNSLIASFFYDALDDIKESDIKHIRDKFNDDVVGLIVNLKKLKDISKTINTTDPETIRAMFVVMAHDMRVILIWLSAFVIAAEKIGDMPEASRIKFAKKCMEVFAPIAGRLGMYEMKHKLEDNSFKYINPAAYNSVYSQLKKFGKQKNKHINEAKTILEKFLIENNIDADVSGRIKSIYSIYRKLKAKNKISLEDIFDVIAMRIVLPTQYKDGHEVTEYLYGILGLIHSKWTPVPNRFKDYIAIPKLNGYQSLHTTVLGIAPRFLDHPVEIQIRSERMHDEAELGVATHWVYEEHGNKNITNAVSNPAQKMRAEWFKAFKNFKNIEDLKGGGFEVGIFEDRIFVLTPKGDVKDLPVGSTVIDFAYNIHTDLGHRAYAAKANGIAVPLHYELKNGDVIEIILKPKSGPKIDWLSFVKTDYAKSRIKDWTRDQKRSYSFKAGKEIIDKHLDRFGKSALDDTLSILRVYDGRELNFSQRKILVGDVGSGAVMIKIFIKKLFSQPIFFQSVKEIQPVFDAPKKKKASAKTKLGDVLVGGEKGLPVKFALCCSPKQGSYITGYVTKHGYIAIHDSKCASLKKGIKNRMVPAAWAVENGKNLKRYTVKIIIETTDRVGLLRDITGVMSEMNVNIVDMVLISRNKNSFNRAFIIDVDSYESVDRIMDHIEDVYGVLRVYTQDVGPRLSV